MSSALYWTTLFLMYWSDSVVSDTTLALWLKGCALAGSAISLFVHFLIMRAGKGKFFDSAAWMLVPVVLSPLAGASALVLASDALALTPSFHCTLWFLSGFGLGQILPHMAYGFYRMERGASFFMLSVSMLISTGAVVFASMLPEASASLAIVVFACPVVSYILTLAKGEFGGGGGKYPKVVAGAADKSDVAREEVKDGDPIPSKLLKPAKSSVSSKSSGPVVLTGKLGPSVMRAVPRKVLAVPLLQMFFYSVSFSFSLFLALSAFGGHMPSECVWFGAFLASIFLVLYSLWVNQKVHLVVVQLVLFGIAALGLAPLAMFDQLPTALRYAASMLLMFSFTSFDMLSMSQMLAIIEACGISYPRYFALARMGNAFGMVVGWGLTVCVIFLDSAFPALHLARSLPVALIVCLVFVILACTMDVQEGRGTDGDEKDEEGGRSKGDTAEAAPWKLACEEICEQYGLSPREREVFALSAKGRDSPFICNELFISAHTVKTHIYHIYGKMGIHSQQELISAVEIRTKQIRNGM